MFHNLKCVRKSPILMMTFNIFESIYKLQLAIKRRKKNIFQDAYKRVTSAGAHFFFSTIYIARKWALSSFIAVTMKINSD